jgi:hypothetical protein
MEIIQKKVWHYFKNKVTESALNIIFHLKFKLIIFLGEKMDSFIEDMQRQKIQYQERLNYKQVIK